MGMKALFHPGLFTAHDIWHQVVRFYYYSQAVNNGQWPPYWIGQLANGFGYPLFFFSYHLPWIIGIILLNIGFNFSDTIKALFFLSFMSSGISMYFFVNSLLKNKLSAALSSILYLWMPYHFLITFVSASIGIAFIFTFLPLIFLGIHLSGENSRFGIHILSVGISGIILSHIMHLIFLLPILVIFLLWELRNTQKRIAFLINCFLAVILGSLISSFYLLPAAYYSKYTKVHQETGFYELYKRNFINFNQLIYSKWGFSPIVNNAKNGEISFQLGVAQWISIITLFLLLILKKISKPYYSLSLYLLLGFTVSIICMLNLSTPLWSFLVKQVSVDFPFRLLLPASFIASICAGIIILNLNKKLKSFAFIFLVLIALYTNRNHINVNEYTSFPISSYLDIETEITTNTFNEYLPTLANPKLLNKPWNEIVGDNLSVSQVKHTTNLLSFNVNATKEQIVSAGQFYFPGQTVYIDNKISSFNSDKDGRISFKLPAGFHIITVEFENTAIIKISKILTALGIIILFFLTFKKVALNKS